MIVMAPISVGELVDKITILKLKLERITDESKLQSVRTELEHLQSTLDGLEIPVDISTLSNELFDVNAALWDIENFKRDCERVGRFESDFILAARQVYLKNDQRAKIKKDINIASGSVIVEEKSYANI